MLELRTVLRAAYDAGRLALVADLQDARAYLTDEHSGISTAIVNTLEIVQAYASISSADDERGTRLQAGQFLLELGSGRLVAAEQYRNVSRGFLGLMAETMSPSHGRLTAFVALPVVTLPEDRHALLANERARDETDSDLAMIGGLWELRRNGRLLDAELYAYMLDENDDRRSPTRSHGMSRPNTKRRCPSASKLRRVSRCSSTATSGRSLRFELTPSKCLGWRTCDISR